MNGQGDGVCSFRLDPADGSLRLVDVAAVPDHYYVAVSRRHRMVYAGTYSISFEGQPGAGVSAFLVQSDGTLRAAGSQRVSAPFIAHISLDSDERFLFAASILGGTISVLPIAADGRLEPTIHSVSPAGRTKVSAGQLDEPVPGPLPYVDPRYGFTTPHSVRAAASDRYLISGNVGQNAVDIIPFDKGSARLREGRRLDLGGDAVGPRTIELHPNGHTVYVSNEIESTVSVCELDTSVGTLEERQRVSTLPPSVPSTPNWMVTGTGRQMASSVVIHPSGRFLYVGNRGPHNSIVRFAVDDVGRLSDPEDHDSGGSTPTEMTLTGSGRVLLVPNLRSNNIAAFAVDDRSGTLRPLTVTTTGSPTCVAVLP